MMHRLDLQRLSGKKRKTGERCMGVGRREWPGEEDQEAAIKLVCYSQRSSSEDI